MKSSILKTAEQLVEGWRLLKWPRSTGGGSKSYALIGTLADMERALLDYALDFIVDRLQGEMKSEGIKGLELVEVDDILPVETTRACGLRQGVSAHPIQYRVFNSHRVFGQDEQNAGTVQLEFNPDSERAFCLSGTAEMGIAHRIKGNIFDECQLPAYFLAESNCFRPEVTRGTKEGGLYRVHEFKKIEMFVVCTERQSERELKRIVGIQKDLFDSLQLQCRILDMPEEELGPAAARKFDIEAWMPGRKVWGELSSASNCTDYQARRLQIRYRPFSTFHSPSLPLHFAHTCNGTGLASSRSLIALLETHQKEHNRVDLPAVIKERMPKERSAAFKCGPAPPIKYNFD